MSKIDLNTARIVSNNLLALMRTYNLTVHGVEAGAGIEVHTLNRILSLTTNMSSMTARKLAYFFGTTVAEIYSPKSLKLKKLALIPTLTEFYEANYLNNKYFQDRAKENEVAYFLREVMILDPFLNSGQRAAQVTKHIKTKYGKDFNAKTVAKELFRLSEKGILCREDPSGKAAVYYYSLANPIQEDEKI